MQNRSALARIGVVVLNLLTPGLGLLRVGQVKAAVAHMSAPILILLIVLGIYASGTTITFMPYIIGIAILLSGLVLLYFSAMIMSWLRSAAIDPAPAWWTRWYAIVGVMVALQLPLLPLVDVTHRYYRPFYIPAESMVPTLLLNDRLLADMRGYIPPKIGDVILFTQPGSTIYIKRLAALPGDRIAMHSGIFFRNGVPARLRETGMTMVTDFDGKRLVSARRFVETLPGERGEHEIVDIGPTEIDDVPEQTVPAGHVYVLGDNRDESADSRVPMEMNGVAMLPEDRIVGRAMFLYWSRDHARIGANINPSQ